MGRVVRERGVSRVPMTRNLVDIVVLTVGVIEIVEVVIVFIVVLCDEIMWLVLALIWRIEWSTLG